MEYQRLLGYKKALAEAGLAYDTHLVMENGGSMLGGYHAAQRITVLPEKATAAFVLSDIGAMGLIKGLNEMGKKVPEDISVVGYDDIFYTEYMIPSLTTIRQDIFKKGMMAAGLLLAQINGEPVPGAEYFFASRTGKCAPVQRRDWRKDVNNLYGKIIGYHVEKE